MWLKPGLPHPRENTLPVEHGGGLCSNDQLCMNSEVVPHESYTSVLVRVSAQDGIIALGNVPTCSALSLAILPKVALETMQIFVGLNSDHS